MESPRRTSEARYAGPRSSCALSRRLPYAAPPHDEVVATCGRLFEDAGAWLDEAIRGLLVSTPGLSERGQEAREVGVADRHGLALRPSLSPRRNPRSPKKSLAEGEARNTPRARVLRAQVSAARGALQSPARSGRKRALGGRKTARSGRLLQSWGDAALAMTHRQEARVIVFAA
jgi:hypothetical protein